MGIAYVLGPAAGIGPAVVQLAAAFAHRAGRRPEVLPITITLLAAVVAVAVTGFNVGG